MPSAAPAATLDGQGGGAAARLPDKFGQLQGEEITEKVLALALEFLHEHQGHERKLVKA